MATDLELLTASFDADITRFEKKMDALGVSFNRQVKNVDKGQADLQKKLSSWSLDFTGITGFQKALVGLTAGAVVGGISDLVKKSLEAASAIGDVAQQAGVSTDFLQKVRFAASQSGASFSDLDGALVTLNKNFGEFVNTGSGRAATAFKQLGIDKLINAGQIRTTEQLFDVLVQKVGAYGNAAQRGALLSDTFGKETGTKLAGLVNAGTAALAQLEAQAVSLGVVLSADVIAGAKDANDKLDALFQVIKAEGVAAVASLAPEIADLAKQITDSLPDLITYVEKWAGYFGLIQLSPVEKLKSQLQDVNDQIDLLTNQKQDSGGLNWFLKELGLGVSDSDFDANIAAFQKKADAIRAEIAKQRPTVASPAAEPAALHVAQTPEQIAAAARSKQALAQTVLDAKTANAALVAAQDSTNVQLLKGGADYFAAVQKQIDDEFNSKVEVAQAEANKQVAQAQKSITGEQAYADAIANIEDALTDKVAAAAAERRRAQDEVGLSSTVREALIAGDQQIGQYKQQTATLGLTAGAAARLAYEYQIINDARQKGITLTQQEIEQTPALKAKADAIAAAADAQDRANRLTQDNIQFADSLRSGLEDVGAAGIQGFGSLKKAAGQFLEQIAELIVKLYVMKPLVESILGPSGASGIGGAGTGSSFFGSLGNLLGFAGGGIMTSRGAVPLRKYAGGGIANSPQLAMFGEGSTPEAYVPVPNGAIPVQLRIPQIAPRGGGGTTVVQNFDLSGALVTNELWAEIDRRSQAQANVTVAKYDRQVLPHRVNQLARDPRRRS